jgi:hypothetical protein
MEYLISNTGRDRGLPWQQAWIAGIRLWLTARSIVRARSGRSNGAVAPRAATSSISAPGGARHTGAARSARARRTCDRRMAGQP